MHDLTLIEIGLVAGFCGALAMDLVGRVVKFLYRTIPRLFKKIRKSLQER